MPLNLIIELWSQVARYHAAQAEVLLAVREEPQSAELYYDMLNQIGNETRRNFHRIVRQLIQAGRDAIRLLTLRLQELERGGALATAELIPGHWSTVITWEELTRRTNAMFIPIAQAVLERLRRDDSPGEDEIESFGIPIYLN
ncbi:MAG TPA: hypothetical protein PKD64_17280 [Pirellulaceae bacterium]|nr:hypothetical protein [Pirellulaceae bacterium]HMO93941.1 hypothetical protein [Pirellulaceae bacterium]HMP69748.1 hypothetical protein [Pirellulaceae bacterium]